METHEVLRKYLKRKKVASKGFSLRELARQLGLSAPFLSRVFSGKKPVPYGVLLRLQEALDIEPEVFAQIRNSHLTELTGTRIPTKGRRKFESSLANWSLADTSNLDALRQWFYLPLLNLTLLPNFDGSLRSAANRLGLALPTIEIAVEELVQMGLLKLVDGRIVKTTKKARWASKKSTPEIRRFHDQMLVKAQQELRQAVSDEDFQQRLITGITVTASAAGVQAAKMKLAECLHEIANTLAEDEGTEVYHLAAQFFPVTKRR